MTVCFQQHNQPFQQCIQEPIPHSQLTVCPLVSCSRPSDKIENNYLRNLHTAEEFLHVFIELFLEALNTFPVCSIASDML